MRFKSSPDPYVGITGFTKQEEVLYVLQETRQELFKAKRKLMVGVLARDLTLTTDDQRTRNRYPRLEDIGSIFVKDPITLGLVHYSTRNPGHLSDALKRIEAQCGMVEGFHGFQLNVPWPSPQTLEFIRHELMPYRTLVLQVGPEAFRQVGYSHRVIADKILDEYQDLVDYVLLDESDGQGEILQPSFIRACLYELMNAGVSPGLVVGGGLSEETADIAAAATHGLRDISVDAEVKLRDDHDRLNLNKSVAYVRAMLSVLK